jgi:BirA family biotin operon repressor/biotin-[acetyl-CoA-carboxylase] ligase
MLNGTQGYIDFAIGTRWGIFSCARARNTGGGSFPARRSADGMGRPAPRFGNGSVPCAIEASRMKGAEHRILGRPDVIEETDVLSRLSSRLFWKSLTIFPVTDSTNSRAAEAAERGAPHGSIFCADAQTGGRGRFDRRWESPPGVNLYLSILLRPVVDPQHAPQLTLVTAVALAKAVEEVAKVPARLKWPNDLYLAGKKAAGILAEMSTDADRLRHVVIGVGLNVNAEESHFPKDLLRSATSLRMATGGTFRRAVVLARFLERFAEGYREFLSGGLKPLLPEWNRRSLIDGKRIKVRCREGDAWGTAAGIPYEGGLGDFCSQDENPSLGRGYPLHEGSLWCHAGDILRVDKECPSLGGNPALHPGYQIDRLPLFRYHRRDRGNGKGWSDHGDFTSRRGTRDGSESACRRCLCTNCGNRPISWETSCTGIETAWPYPGIFDSAARGGDGIGPNLFLSWRINPHTARYNAPSGPGKKLLTCSALSLTAGKAVRSSCENSNKSTMIGRKAFQLNFRRNRKSIYRIQDVISTKPVANR